MTEAEALLTAVRADPDSDAPRLIYADWLEQRADPRARLIRVQCALARLKSDDAARPELLAEERLLLHRYGELWLRELADLAPAGAEFRRGFVETVNLEARQLLGRGAELFERAPIRHVRLLDFQDCAATVLRSPLLGRLSELTIANQHLGSRLIAALADAPAWVNLTALRIGRNRLGGIDLRPIVCRQFPKLRELDLSENGLTDSSILHLADATLPALEQLDLHRNDLGLAVLERLGVTDTLPSLLDLNLRYNRIGRALARSEMLLDIVPRLRRLDLSHNELELRTLRLLEDCKFLAGLEALDLSHNALGNMGAVYLSAWPHLHGLKQLSLAGNMIGDDGIRSLVTSIHWGRLMEFDLSHNPLHDDGAMAVLEAKSMRHLRRLEMSYLGLSPRMRAVLQARFGR